MNKKTNLTFLVAAVLTSCTLFAQVATSGYKISKKMNTGVDAGWDYLIVDEPTQRLFVSHGMVTQVVDIKSGTLLSTITDTKGVHGIAIANDHLWYRLL